MAENEQLELIEPTGKQLSAEEQAKRSSARLRLADYLKDPQFRAIEGFPIGSDEDILALSDPPYYTACPNPFLPEIIAEWQQEREEIRKKLGLDSPRLPGEGPGERYQREPFAADVSEGKNDPIYNAHSYHTKVPHKAIMRYILHYTDPGDIVFDGFCGTGMTGVAAQLCGDKKAVEELGYRVDDKDVIWDGDKAISRLGVRKAVLNDLSPAATFIAYNYNTPVDTAAFEREAKRILREVEQECGWMYETTHVEPASCRFINHHLHFNGLAGSQSHLPEPEPASITDFTIRQGDLPHWQIPGTHYFITFTTHNRRVLSESARQIVLDALCFWDGKRLDLIAAVVMPDHVHAVLAPRQNDSGGYWDLSTLLHSIKSYSANEINRIENCPGQTVWLSETYDHIIRDETEYQRILTYLAANPVKAGLVQREEVYAWFYLCSVLGDGWKPSPQGKINYTVWSEVFTCPQCGKELVYFDVAVEKETFAVNDSFKCPGCEASLEKRSLERVWESYYDQPLQHTHKLVKYKPVLISYQLGKLRYEKQPDREDLDIIDKVERTVVPGWFPSGEMLDGERKRKDGYHLKGITHLHHFYFRRPLLAYSELWKRTETIKNARLRNYLKFYIQGACQSFTKMNRYRHDAFSQLNQIMSGTMFVGSLTAEISPSYALTNKLNRLLKLNYKRNSCNIAITAQSTTSISYLQDSVIDYIFIDPPFGNNLHYSELNYFWESWLRLLTAREPEAVMDKGRNRTLADYEKLMYSAFQELFRVIRPGRWITVEFHNSQNSVWNAIQLSLQQAGFVVADVRTLDKQQETYKQSVQNLVKQDLIITAYKPNGKLEENFHLKAGNEDGVWEFVRYHLGKLPVVNQSNGTAMVNAERQAYLLFDRMVAFHIQRGVMVPISSPEFYAGLEQRFTHRDGMYFLPDQVAEYDRALLDSGKPTQIPLFVTDEKTAITWLRQQLDPASGGEPQTRGDLTNKFNQTMHRAKHEKALELIEILEQNFLQDEIDKWYVPNHNKASDLEKVRQRSLLREFGEYINGTGRLRQFRTEAVRAGFADCFRRQDYGGIINVAERLPEDVLRKDPDLLMYFDSATLRKK